MQSLILVQHPAVVAAVMVVQAAIAATVMSNVIAMLHLRGWSLRV